MTKWLKTFITDRLIKKVKKPLLIEIKYTQHFECVFQKLHG